MRLRLLLLLLIVPAAGCLWTPRPYASDPLVRHRRATVGEFEKAGVEVQTVEPQPPDEND